MKDIVRNKNKKQSRFVLLYEKFKYTKGAIRIRSRYEIKFSVFHEIKTYHLPLAITFRLSFPLVIIIINTFPPSHVIYNSISSFLWKWQQQYFTINIFNSIVYFNWRCIKYLSQNHKRLIYDVYSYIKYRFEVLRKWVILQWYVCIGISMQCVLIGTFSLDSST